MASFFNLMARGVGSLTLFGGGRYCENLQEISLQHPELLLPSIKREEREMLKDPVGQLAWAFQRVGKAMSGAIADVKQEQGI